MRVVFFGTPAFAVPSLQALLDAGHEVVAVVTQPDRPQGRSRSVLVPSPVKQRALAAGLPVLQPDKPVGDDFVAALTALRPDIGVVAAYGHLLRPHVLAIPSLGMINVHASLLPRWRGAAPIQWAIRAGDRDTGVSIMHMEAGLDSGPWYLQRRTPIEPVDTGGTVTERLARLGADALPDALGMILHGAIPTPQDAALATLAPKVDRDTAHIPWHEEAALVDRHIRAFDPVPGAWSTLDGTDVKCFGARAVEPAATVADGSGAAPLPGTVLRADDRLVVQCGRGAVRIDEVQPAGRKRQPVAD
ncbi:MAG: methionyl-tRNA formyltransferase, partial [Gemmatimonadales bacterium]|nr:methionyl-tRNA formyltransferase [Gemmatimonadales bacterium]